MGAGAPTLWAAPSPRPKPVCDSGSELLLRELLLREWPPQGAGVRVGVREAGSGRGGTTGTHWLGSALRVSVLSLLEVRDEQRWQQ